MKKDSLVFFLAIATNVAVIFIFLASAPPANAYEISTSADGGSNYNYNIGGSFQNLISPFKGFINDLQWTNDSSTSVGLHLVSTPLPPLNIATSLQTIIGQWLSEFDNWFDQSTGVQLSGVIILVLNIVSWTLHAAEDLVNWLLGLFH